MLPTRRLRQQAPEDVDRAVLLVDGHGAGLRPGLLSSVEPSGIVGTPSCEVPLLEVALLEALDCEDAVPPATGAWPHILVDRPVLLEVGTVPVGPSGVMPKTPRPSPLKGAVEFIAFPVTVLVGEHAPTDEPELTPGVASGGGSQGNSRWRKHAPGGAHPERRGGTHPGIGGRCAHPTNLRIRTAGGNDDRSGYGKKATCHCGLQTYHRLHDIRSVSSRFPAELPLTNWCTVGTAGCKRGCRCTPDNQLGRRRRINPSYGG